MSFDSEKSKKVLVVAAICFPPCLIGPAILMGNLFRHFPKGSYHVLMGRLDHQWLPLDMDSMLPAQYTFTRYPSFNLRGNLFRRIRTLLRDIVALLEYFWKGLKIIRTEGVDTIFVVADHYVELPALLMHWLTGKKIVIWLPDLYYHPDHKFQTSKEKFIHKYLERIIFLSSNHILVQNETTKHYYAHKYSKHTLIMRHTVDLESYHFTLPLSLDKNVYNIVYTGMVNYVYSGPMLDMIEVIEGFKDITINFKVMTPTSRNVIEDLGVKGRNVYYNTVNREALPAVQKSADILFLPLTFDYYSDLNLRTGLSCKLPEYLAAGRPILVYAPPHSYYVKYAREHKFALVVDQPDSNLLREAIIKLKNDQSLCKELATNARRVAKEYHDAVKVSAILQNIIL